MLKIAPESILHQVGQILEAQANLPLEGVISQVKTERSDLFEGRCAAVRRSFEQFSAAASAALHVLESGGSFYHGPYYVIEGWAADLEFELAVHQGNSLFAWASETYESLQACER